MNDETKAALAWARGAVESHDLYRGARDERDGSVENMRSILAHIDGEPARLAAAREEAIMAWRAGAADRDELRADCERRIAAAREEQREACELRLRQRADDIVSDGGDKTLAIHMHRAADWIEDTPLDATPLADELRALLDAYDTARAEGVAAERARVVAWLRAADSETLVWFAAQRIEQGWHDKEGE